MESFHWNNCFNTGVAQVDDQHHHLVDVINRFGALLTSDAGVSSAHIESVFGELADYAIYHFREEEGLMVNAGIDQRHLAIHRQAHASFLEEVTRMHSGMTAGTTDAAKFLLRFLTHWLAYHILGQDQVMAAQITAIRSGKTPKQAFEESERGHDPATDMLLHALNGLFHQVSDRNKELYQLNQTLESKVAERTRELSAANQRLEDMAMTDILTGLPNRRHALRSFEREWALATTDNSALACMMIDADGFKQINDTRGHDAGDAVLRELARALAYAVRTDDVVCRLGGDEFFIICPRTPLSGALKFAEELRSQIAALHVPAGEWRGSISVGVAARTPEVISLDALMKAADDGVYAAKRAGRNCVRSVQPDAAG